MGVQPLNGSTRTLGEQILVNGGIFPHKYWYWLGAGVLLAYIFLFNTMYTIVLTWLNRKFLMSFSFLILRAKLTADIFVKAMVLRIIW